MKTRKRTKNRQYEQSYKQRLDEIDNQIKAIHQRFPYLTEYEQVRKIETIDKLECQQRVKWREHHPILFYGQNT